MVLHIGIAGIAGGAAMTERQIAIINAVGQYSPQLSREVWGQFDAMNEQIRVLESMLRRRDASEKLPQVVAAADKRPE